MNLTKNENLPRVGVGIIITSGNFILLAKRKNSHGSGSWTAPGGHLEINEKTITAALRETEEEAGLKLNSEKIKELGFTEDFFEKEDKHYVTCFFHYEADKTTTTPIILEKNKFDSEWIWFKKQELPTPLFIPISNALKKFKYLL